MIGSNERRGTMFIAKVIAPLVSTEKLSFFEGRKLLVIKEVLADGKLSEKSRVAIDFVQAGVGDTVLAMRNGSSMDVLVNESKAPANLALIGIIDAY